MLYYLCSILIVSVVAVFSFLKKTIFKYLECRQRGPSYTIEGVVNCVTIMEISVEIIQKDKSRSNT